MEAAFTVLALRDQQLPPTLNLDDPEPTGTPSVEHVPVGHVAAAARGGRPLRAALCNSFGFGGMNASLLFSRWDAE